MAFIDKIKNAMANGAANLFEKAGKALDDNITNKEELIQAKTAQEKVFNDFTVQMAEIAYKEAELEIKDKDSARNREIQIATSEHAPLLNKIVQPVIAIIVIVSTIVIWALILFRNYEPKTNEAMIIGSLTTLTGMVLSYYFGSSTGSHAKQKQLDKMMK